MVVQLLPALSLLPGSLALPADDTGPPISRLRLGTLSVPVTVVPEAAPPGELWLAPDIWTALAIGLGGFRMDTRRSGDGELELGPAVVVLYRDDECTAATAPGRLPFYFSDRYGMAGLLAISGEAQIDWERGLMTGYLLDNRSGQAGTILPATIPIPSVVRLTWSHDREVVRRLREVTGNRTFNWIRNIGKWELHTLLAADSAVALHLPETRLLKGPVDLAVMLARHRTVFVKDVFSIRGKGVARIRQGDGGLEVTRMKGRRMISTTHPDIPGALAAAQEVAGAARKIVQQGIAITGQHGRALDFRVLMARAGEVDWRCLGSFAKVAPDSALPFCNAANGAADEEGVEALQRHHGMSAEAAVGLQEAMCQLCQQAARTLARKFDPLGLLGFDVAVEAGTHRLLILEVNSVPGWGYSPPFDCELARSQAEYALSLTGFPITKGRQPS